MNSAGRYEILGRLGRGGMSTVYKASAPVTGRIVALKILKPRDDIFVDLVGEARLREIFIEEARIMGGITHDHVAKVIDCDEDEGVPFIVLEYFAHSIGAFIGESYQVERPSRVVGVPRAYRYLEQTLKGLERLHFAGIVHRDIKPFNLMITNDDRVKIIDFGLSRVRGEEKMAIPGMQVGSPYYAAPEQETTPGKADGRADLYSLGVLMYRMLTGRLVDPRYAPVVAASTLNGDLNRDWDLFLQKCLAVEPSERFADVQEMRLELEGLYGDWVAASENSCAVQAGELVDIGEPDSVRSRPNRIMFKDMRQALGLDQLFRLRRFCRQKLHAVNPLLLHDPVTGLNWQSRGSGFTLNWQQAKEYVQHLNDLQWQGRANWRLPTTAELATILRSPSVRRDFCLETHFSPAIHWLWSSDYCTKKQAWMVDIVESYIERLDMDGTASVCAVCS